MVVNCERWETEKGEVNIWVESINLKLLFFLPLQRMDTFASTFQQAYT